MTKPLYLDSGAVDRLAREDRQSFVDVQQLRKDGYWPPVVHTVVLSECVSGRARDDVPADRLIKICQVLDRLPERVARRAGELRTKSQRGSAVDAILVALAEPDGAVMTNDLKDFEALASNAQNVTIVSSNPSKR